ncbi:MAG TPA: tyrosine-type recombinase/integrase [Rhodocyclaceae bacterium]|nr:tyrosine-type recombinase/integrase [Rhodocyclaceae bacterium]
MNVSEACELFLNHCGSAISLSKHTLRAYQSDLRDIENYLGSLTRLDAVSKEHLRLYIRHLREQRQFKETSIKRRIACMKLLFRWAIHESIVQSNPFDTLNERIRLPRRLPRALDSVDAARLRQSVVKLADKGGYDLLCHRAAIHLLMDTGIRVGELSSICISDMSLSDRCIRIQGKGNRQRLVYMLSPSILAVMKCYLAERHGLHVASDKLFVTSDGRELTPPLVRRSLRDLAAQAGLTLRVTPHMLRHTCATQWLESGLDIRYVQKLLGHHSISTTEIYTHVSDQGLRDALSRAVGGKR